MSIAVGKPAPDFTLNDAKGKPVGAPYSIPFKSDGGTSNVYNKVVTGRSNKADTGTVYKDSLNEPTGVALNFPWLWRGKYRAMQQEAKADLAMAQADFDNEVNATMLEIKELYTKVESAIRLAKVFEAKLLPQARQLIETTRAGYEAGNATFLELVEAQKLWRDAQLGYERARAEAGKAHAKLDAIAAPWGAFEFASGLVSEDMQ